MPEPDPRWTRLVELRRQLDTLAEQVYDTPVDAPGREALDKEFMALLEQVVDLRAELGH